MISFKQFLAESRYAPLYHGTNVKNALSILKQNVIRAHDAEDDLYPAVSFSRDLNYAKRWVIDNNIAKNYNDLVVFVFNQETIKYNYKLFPHNFFYHAPAYHKNSNDDEYEERVKSNINNVHKYISYIIVFSSPTQQKIDNFLIINNIKLQTELRKI